MEIISVNVQKGGSGKTTTVQALAELLSKVHKKKVLCIDADPQCDLSTVSGIDIDNAPEHNLFTLLSKEHTLKECIYHSKYYDIIPGSYALVSASTDFNCDRKEYFLKDQIATADYDYILIDTPPALGILNIMSLTASTQVIIPSECSYLSMLGINKLYETIETVKKYSNKKLRIAGVLAIKYNARTNINVTIANGLQQMADLMHTKVFDSKIRETVKIKEAQSQQCPLLDWAPKCSAISDYKKFVKELIG